MEYSGSQFSILEESKIQTQPSISLTVSFLGLVWFVWFYGISTFVGYLMPNPFLCK